MLSCVRSSTVVFEFGHSSLLKPPEPGEIPGARKPINLPALKSHPGRASCQQTSLL